MSRDEICFVSEQRKTFELFEFRQFGRFEPRSGQWMPFQKWDTATPEGKKRMAAKERKGRKEKNSKPQIAQISQMGRNRVTHVNCGQIALSNPEGCQKLAGG